MPRLYDLDAARSEEQRAYMADLEERGICIFCGEYAGDRQPIELTGTHWYVMRNAFPYPGTEAHLLIVPHAHVTSFDQLLDEAGAELWSIRRRLKARYPARAYATVERSDDMRCSGASVAHLHTHFVALGEAPERTVRFRVSARGAAS